VKGFSILVAPCNELIKKDARLSYWWGKQQHKQYTRECNGYNFP